MSLVGFNCKECDKPFFVMHNTPQCLKDDESEIKKYQRLGYVFTEIPDDTAGDINNWCPCHDKKD